MGGRDGTEDSRPPSTPRRVLLRHGVAAGLVWVTPAIRTVRPNQVAGSPAPGSTTTPPQPTAYTFTGLIPIVGVDPEFFQVCTTTERSSIAFTTDLGPLGTSSVEIEACVAVEDPFLMDIAGGGLMVSAADGTLVGVVTGGVLDRFQAGPSDWAVEIEFDITGGTGLYDGAVGTAVLDGILHFNFVGPPTIVVWELDGTFGGDFVVG